ncbi:claudin-10 [Astyanax mexicanus]|uniref:claudin-10 n=1 Tax=Astyanax mexicanus TaxID=7994 RepID=UPI0020CB2C6E|nr:claudin-10 [Astyanax mexicanus]
MHIRVQQIWGFLQTVLGWIFIVCSLAMEGWKVAATGGQGGSAVVIVAWHWSNLWRACSTDANGVSNCYDFPVLWSVERYIQIVRALLMTGMAVGVLGFILSMVGMECTYIGGKEKEKNRSIFIGGLCHCSSGLLAAAGYGVYAWHVSAEYFSFDLQYDLGTPLFLGWAGCLFQICGGIFYLLSVQKVWSEENSSALYLMVSDEEGKLLNSTPIISDLSIKSKVSTLSELSLLTSSTVSKISPRAQQPSSV